MKPGAQDPGALRFNHAVHMKDNLRGPARPGDSSSASTCHRPEVVAGRGRGEAAAAAPG